MYPFEPYRLELGFKKDAWYGPHEGWDLNVKGTWGDQDCGTQYKAVADGEVILATKSSENYGNLLILRCETPKGTRWVRYAHCDQFVVKSGSVKRGDVLATMGDSGNSTACHLHLDILKKKPYEWRYYTKTKIDEYFEDPEVFFADENGKIDEMPEWLKTLLQERNLTIEDEGEIRAIFDRAKRYDDEVKELRDKLNQLTRALQISQQRLAFLLERLNKKRIRFRNSRNNLIKQEVRGIRRMRTKSRLRLWWNDLRRSLRKLESKLRG